MIFLILAGTAGGALRGLVGYLKHRHSYKNVKFRPARFLTTLLIAGTIGGMTAAATAELAGIGLGVKVLTPAVALVVGYAGGDFLENLYKIVRKKS